MGSAVWRAKLSDEGGAVIAKRQLLADSALDYGPQPSPDGQQIVFESMRSGHDEIWKNNADGSDPRKLTSLSGTAGTPRWSADGKWIVFDYLPENENHRQIFVIDEEGRDLHLVVSGNYTNAVPSWSRDGNAIYFTSDRAGSFQIWRHELATGREVQITRDGGFASFESFDGKTLYFSKLNGGGIWAMPVKWRGSAAHYSRTPFRLLGRICGYRKWPVPGRLRCRPGTSLDVLLLSDASTQTDSQSEQAAKSGSLECKSRRVARWANGARRSGHIQEFPRHGREPPVTQGELRNSGLAGTRSSEGF
jgi:hypothetical protein